tara:strand:- start:71 stop:175 length:105 start_codon:yes stop_codon:yes gene_type:complete
MFPGEKNSGFFYKHESFYKKIEKKKTSWILLKQQ